MISLQNEEQHDPIVDNSSMHGKRRPGSPILALRLTPLMNKRLPKTSSPVIISQRSIESAILRESQMFTDLLADMPGYHQALKAVAYIAHNMERKTDREEVRIVRKPVNKQSWRALFSQVTGDLPNSSALKRPLRSGWWRLPPDLGSSYVLTTSSNDWMARMVQLATKQELGKEKNGKKMKIRTFFNRPWAKGPEEIPDFFVYFWSRGLPRVSHRVSWGHIRMVCHDRARFCHRFSVKNKNQTTLRYSAAI